MATPTVPGTVAVNDPATPRRTAPSSAVQALRLARYQLRDYLLSRRFILMMTLVAIIGIIFTAVVGYYRPAGLLASSNDFYSTLWVSGVTVVIIFAGVIFGGDAIAGEFANKTGYFLMGQPIRRATVYAGKYMAAFAAAFVSFVAFALILLGNAAYYFGGGAVTGAFAESFFIAMAYLLALLGTTFLFSSLFKTSTYAVLVVAVLFLFGFTVLEDLVAGLVKIEPWFILTYGSHVIGYPFLPSIPPHVAMTSVGPPGSPTITTYSPTYAEGIGILLGYFGLTTIGGLVFFEWEEFT